MTLRAFPPSLLVTGLGLVVLCCQPGPPPSRPPEASERLLFSMKTKEKTFDGCVAGAEGCAYVRFDYPVVVEAPRGVEIGSITESIREFLDRPLREQEQEQGQGQGQEHGERETATAITDRFIEDYRAFRAKEPRSGQVWYVERKAFVLESTPHLLSLSFSERSYLGGNERIATLRFRNLDPGTGTDLSLSDVLRPGAEEKLRILAESRFREARGIEEGKRLDEAGFTFERGEFRLTDNFSLGAKGLTFYYNAAEVGAASLGPTEILLTYPEITDLIDPRFVSDEAT
jgi:Protein of unknown function (DUF3298)